MDKEITIYHGSNKIVETPIYGEGRKNNDFGLGFYCTLSNELSKEWAVSSIENGYSNKYTLDLEYLKILNLNSPEYTILNWIAILLEHRIFSIKTPIAKKAREYIIDNFGININKYDVIIGYRADDSYFDYASAFINNEITIEQLSSAMRLGKLGEQIVIKSKYAFSKIKFEGFELALMDEYYPLKKQRNDTANRMYYNLLEKAVDGLYVLDIIRGGIKNDDARIPRNISN